MTDLFLGSDNDLFFENGQLVLIKDTEVLVRQRLLNKLRTFTGTLFTNINYGIDTNLIFQKGTKDLLDQHLKTLISNTTGIIALKSFESSVSTDRQYTCKFQYTIETGEIVGISGLAISTTGVPSVVGVGIWKDGYWDYSGVWDDDEIWGGKEIIAPPAFTVWDDFALWDDSIDWVE